MALEAFNFEYRSEYSIRVRTTDQSGLYYEKVFQIYIKDVAESPYGIVLNSSTVTVFAEVGSTIGSLSAVDPDGNDSFTFSLIIGQGDDDNEFFVVEGDLLKIQKALDYENY